MIECRGWLECFGNASKIFLESMYSKSYSIAYSARHSGCHIHFSAPSAGPVQNSSISDLGSIEFREKVLFYLRGNRNSALDK